MTINYKNILGASLFALAFSLNTTTAVAQTCSTPPDCKTLGFTKTAADCSGKTILKCPFNQRNVYCPGSEEYSRTYNIGDSYLANGIVVGKVYKIDSSKMHGSIVLSAPKSGTKIEANNYCNALRLGGMIWNLPALKDMKTICDKKVVTWNNVDHWLSDNEYVSWIGCSDSSYTSSNGTKYYYCIAEF